MKTTEYKKFAPCEHQRSINPPHVRKLVKSMKENGFFPSMPIIVRKNGGNKFHIIDGHHRWLAAKEARVPVHYTVATSGEAMALINSLQRTWSNTDWLMHYVRKRRKHYVELYKLMQAHDIKAPLLAASLLTGTSGKGGSVGRRFRAGDFTVTEREHFDMVIALRDSIIRSTGHTVPSSGCAAISNACLIEGFDHARMISGLGKSPPNPKQLHSRQDWLDALERSYNFRYSKNGCPLRFLAEKEAKRRERKGLLRGRKAEK